MNVTSQLPTALLLSDWWISAFISFINAQEIHIFISYREVPFSFHTHYCKPVHSLIQLICMLFCSQRNNQNHKERKTNPIIKFLTANLRYLKICIPSKTDFSYSVKFSVESTRSDITFQDCISFYKCYKSAWHIQASLSQCFPSFLYSVLLSASLGIHREQKQCAGL